MTDTEPKTTVDLLPCPFCGNDVSTQGFWYGCVPGDEPRGYHIFCLECSETDTLDGPRRDTLAEAVTAWNRRATPKPASDAGAEPLSDAHKFDAEIQWLKDVASYFRGRPTNGEDKAFWSNVANSQTSTRIAELLATAAADKAEIATLQARVGELEAGLPDLKSVIAWLENGCDPAHAVTELRIYQSRAAALRSTDTGEK